MNLTTVEEVTGNVGKFKVKVKKRPRYVSVKECTACGDCEKVCPVLVPNEFESGLTSRRAIYQLFPQAVPAAFVIDMEHCLGTNPIACGKCAEVCPKEVITPGRPPAFDLDNCIGCLCCAEICPRGIIYPERNWFARWIGIGY